MTMEINNPVYVIRVDAGEVVSLQVIDQVVHIEVPVPSALGPTGPAGADGATIIYGAVDPTTEGVDGDGYINTVTSTFFGPRAGGVWPAGVSLVGPQGDTGPTGATGAQGPQGDAGPQGATGPAGPQGDPGDPGLDANTIFYGTGDPTSGQGADGDFYINTTSHFLFGPKAAGAWPAGTSLIGPTGATGPTGPQGDPGPTGAAGADGADGAPGATGPAGVDGADGATGPAGPGVAVGGTTNQALVKTSATDFATVWAAIANSVHGRTGAVVGAAADYGAVSDMESLGQLISKLVGTGVISLLKFSSIADRAVEFDADLGVLQITPHIFKLNAREDAADTEVRFAGARTPYTTPARLRYVFSSDKFEFNRPFKALALEPLVAGTAIEMAKTTFTEPTTMEDDLFGRDVYVGMDLVGGDPSLFFGGSAGSPSSSIIYVSDDDWFLVSNPLQVYGFVGVDGHMRIAPAGGADPTLAFGAGTGLAGLYHLYYDVSEDEFHFDRGLLVGGTLKADVVGEATPAGGVTIDGVRLQDSQVNTDQINEKTSAAGVTVDSLLIKDGVARTEESFQIALDGGGATITTGAKGFYIAPFAMTITGWTLVADQSGSIAIDVWKDTYANHPPVDADSVVTPSITTATKNQASSLSIAVAKGDVLRFNVDSCTSIQQVTLALTGVRV